MAVFSGNGSAASPSFTFSGDTDTGIYLDSANNLAISTAGSSRFRIQGTGEVVIGQGGQSPDYPLHVIESAGTMLGLHRRSTNISAGSDVGLNFIFEDTADSQEYISGRIAARARYPMGGSAAQEDSALVFSTPNNGTLSEVMWIDSDEVDGVAIGGTLPSAPNITLSSAGNIVADGNITADRYNTSNGTTIQTATKTGVTADGTAQTLFSVTGGSFGGYEFTAFIRDSTFPTGTSVQKLWLTVRGSGATYTGFGFAYEDKASTNSGSAGFPGSWSAALNGNSVELSYTHSNTGATNLVVNLVMIGNAGTLNVL